MKFILSAFFSAFLLLSFVFAGYAQTTATTTNAPDKFISEFDVNGLKVIVKRRPSSPTVSAGLFVRGGVKNQTAQNAGIENLTLSTAAEASKKFPRETLRAELSRMGSSVSAGSGYDFGVVSLASTRQNFDKTWEIFSDIVLNPSFTAEDFALVRERVLTGLRNQSVSPDNSLNALEEKVVYAGHPYAIDPSGTIETVSSLKIEDLRAFHKNLLQTSRLLLVVVGDLDAETVRKQITNSFGILPRGDYAEKPTPPITFSQGSVEIAARTVETNYVKGVFAAPSLGDPDYYAMRVAMTILQSRVYQEVRTKRNLSYAPNAEMGSNAANTGNIYVTAVDANQAVSVMLREVESMRKDALDEDNFTGVPGYFLTTYYINQETNAAQVAELARYELLGGGWRNSLTFLDKIRSVTPQDVKRVSEKYMKNLRFVAVGNPSAINKQIFLQN
jgi:zinc protease